MERGTTQSGEWKVYTSRRTKKNEFVRTKKEKITRSFSSFPFFASTLFFLVRNKLMFQSHEKWELASNEKLSICEWAKLVEKLLLWFFLFHSACSPILLIADQTNTKILLLFTIDKLLRWAKRGRRSWGWEMWNFYCEIFVRRKRAKKQKEKIIFYVIRSWWWWQEYLASFSNWCNKKRRRKLGTLTKSTEISKKYFGCEMPLLQCQ